MNRTFLLAFLTGLAAPVAASGGDAAPPARELWLYAPTNLLVDANVDKLEALLRRAARAGYTAFLIADSKFSRLEDMDERYFRNVERVKRLAAELKLEAVPAVFPVGYSSDILSRDPDLAEALPVREALFVVRGGEARVAADPAVALRGGDFADLADLKLWDWKDDLVTAEGGAVRMTDPRGQNARLVQKVKLQPFRLYHLSVRVKTADFRGEPRVAVLAGERSLNHASLGVKRTQEWTTHHVVFNSLEASEAGIYLGAWGAETGSLWWDDARFEEAGPVNLVRRPGAPLTVRIEDGKALEEGRDFERLVDPGMGSVPWAGEFDVWHEPPVIRAKLPDGTRLRVSYYHAITVHEGQVMICPSEPRTLEILREHARRVHAAWGARSYFMSHDEVRILNWCGACQARGLDAGKILADNVRQCAAILRQISPGGRILVWSDMFDPHHNARDGYYLVRGTLAGAWEGLEKDVIAACWHYEKRAESLRWFAERGQRMLLAGYYDAAPGQVRGWLEAARPYPGVLGVMYTTWQGRYDDLEEFARIVRSDRP